MAQRSDISIDWHLSPRIIRIAAPSTEVTIQDLHDTVREIESRPENIVHESIISSAGKEELGGGVLVGLTATLLNAKVAFDARKISISSGTISLENSNKKILTDSSADFISDGVVQGAWIVNISDESVASVVSVLSPTDILTDGLNDGYLNEFSINDSYKIWNIVQGNIRGGNLVAVDNLGNDIAPVLPSVGTQIVRTSSSSATLQELQDIQFASFEGGISVNNVSGSSGTKFPIGTPRQPVDNFSDALDILNSRNLSRMFIFKPVTINNAFDFRNLTFTGARNDSSMDIQSNVQTDGSEFKDLDIKGSFDGYVKIKDCVVRDIEYTDGSIENSALKGKITLNNSQEALIINCHDGFASDDVPILDCGGSGSATIRGYKGNLNIVNKSSGGDITIDMDNASVILDSTVTGGNIIIRGVGNLVDNSSGANIDSSNVVSPKNVSDLTFRKNLPFLVN